MPELDIFDRSNHNKHYRYSPQERIYALMILESDQRERAGKQTPKYTYYAEMLDIPVQTLRQWYRKKDELYKESEGIAKGVIQGVQLQIALSLPNLIQKLNESLDSGEMKDKDKINMFRELVNKLRLLGNESTKNIAHKHDHQFQPVIPENK